MLIEALSPDPIVHVLGGKVAEELVYEIASSDIDQNKAFCMAVEHVLQNG
jgi:hypothetical protein